MKKKISKSLLKWEVYVRFGQSYSSQYRGELDFLFSVNNGLLWQKHFIFHYALLTLKMFRLVGRVTGKSSA